MTTKKVTTTTLLDEHISTLTVTVNPTDAGDIYPQINFVQDLEFVGSLKFVDVIADPAATTVLRLAPAGAAISGQDKWVNNNDNYQCLDTALLALTGNPRTCAIEANSFTVFVSPPINTSTKKYVDLSTKAISAESSKDVTIKVFVKFLGLTQIDTADLTTYTGITDEVDLLRYGTNMRVTLKKISSTRIDLYLRNSSQQIVATYENFQDRIGKWTHITLSYSSYWDAANTAIWDYYPDRLNFQVGNKQLTITQGTFDKLTIANFLTLTIPKEVIALWTRGTIGYDYYTGFMSIYSSINSSAALKYSTVKRTTTADKNLIFVGTSASDCLETTNYFTSATVSALTYNCVRDFEFQIDERAATYNCGLTALGETACESANANCPLGFIENTGDICSCSNKDKKLMLLNKNSGKNKCQSNSIKSKKKFSKFKFFYTRLNN